MPKKIKLDTSEELFLAKFKALMESFEEKPLGGIERALFHYIQTSYQQFMCIFGLNRELNLLSKEENNENGN